MRKKKLSRLLEPGFQLYFACLAVFAVASALLSPMLGAAEGVSYLVVAGIVGWSLTTKVRTGSGLPAGPYGLLGAAEGVAYLTVVAIAAVFGLQFFQQGSLPGPLPSEQCFG